MTDTIHIMLDLETWGKRAGCDIRSIGTCVFDPMTGDVSIPCETCKGGKSFGNIHTFSGDCSDCMNTRMERGFGETFYIAAENPLSSYDDIPFYHNRKYKLDRDPETVKWWSKQSPEAQSAFENPIDLRESLVQFAEWLWLLTGRKYVFNSEGQPDDIRLWANDPQFDVSILEHVYHAVGLPVPWHYRAPRSLRTVTELAGLEMKDYCNYGDAHNALHDAIAQAMTVCKAYEMLGLRK